MPKFQFTNEDFNYFTKRVHEFANLFNLKHIQIRTTFINNPEPHELAKFYYDPENQSAIIGLNKNHNNNYSNNKQYILDRAAIHETAEILLNPLAKLATQLYNKEFVLQEVHKIVNTIAYALIDNNL